MQRVFRSVAIISGFKWRLNLSVDWCNPPLVIARVHPVHAMDAEQRQVAADLWTHPTDLSHKLTCSQLGNYINHRHLLLLSPNVDTHFAIPRRV